LSRTFLGIMKILSKHLILVALVALVAMGALYDPLRHR